MRQGRVIALVGAALIAGMALGSFGIASAAVDTSGTPSVAGRAGVGLRLGQAIRDAGGTLADIVAKLTGLPVEDVREQRAEGRSFGEIAESKGVEAEDIVEEAVAARKALLDDKVADGTITREQADAALDRMRSRLEDRVERTGFGRRGAGRGLGGRGGFGGGCGGCGGTNANAAY